MKHDYWHNKWESNQIAFHNDTVHPMLAQHWFDLNLKSEARIFVPLCGKTRDIAWLLSLGHHIVGSELSEIAVEQLFVEMSIQPKVFQLDNLIHYTAPNIDIYVGDIFNLTAEQVGTIDATYDRAALVALPSEMRVRYSHHLNEITQHAVQCLICFEYDQDRLNGPPFSISEQELIQHYSAYYQLESLARVDVDGGLKGQCPAVEIMWHLSPKSY
jgi:thiopurine S-methyltransferase